MSKIEQIIEKYMLMVEKISNTTRIARNYGTDTEIYRSEIHIIQLIGNYEHLHVSEIARKIGVTKGAVSQILKKLERKKLVQKYLDINNNTRQQVKLTDKGKIAFNGHDKYHRENDQEMFSFLENLNDHDLSVLTSFIDKVDNVLKGHY